MIKAVNYQTSNGYCSSSAGSSSYSPSSSTLHKIRQAKP
jgi:hypothetical protein